MQSRDFQLSFARSSRSLSHEMTYGPDPFVKVTGGFRSNVRDEPNAAPAGTVGFKNGNASRRSTSASPSLTNPGPIRDKSLAPACLAHLFCCRAPITKI